MTLFRPAPILPTLLIAIPLILCATGCPETAVEPSPDATTDSQPINDTSDIAEEVIDQEDLSTTDLPVSDLADAITDIPADVPVDQQPSDIPIECGPNAHPQGGGCVCDDGYVGTLGGECVICFENAHCGGRICSAFVCRNCQTHEECGADLYCGDDGVCTATPPACIEEGARRCFNHQVQYCQSEIWVDDDSGECAFGCNEDSGDCYSDSSVGWIGGRCDTPTDCDRITDGSVACLPPDEGFVEGMCTQRCTSTCPDQYEDTDTVTFCLDSEGLNDAGICIARCDFELFSDSGCRAGFECREMARFGSSSVRVDVCLPINWYLNPSRYFAYGVMSGEVTASSAVVWAHTGEIDTGVEVFYGTSDDTLDQVATSESVDEDGYTVQVELTELSSNTDYAYRFVSDGVAESPIGHFLTAPSSSQPVRFMFSGDVDQTIETNEIFDVMSSFDFDFFFNLGDWPIGDSANTVEEYRDVHALGRTDSRIQTFLLNTSTYSIFDDHEVYNDWDATYRASHPASVEAGLQVWAEWWPLTRQVPDEFYRSFRWGDLEFFLLDTRTHRDARSATDGPSKSMLGETQRTWLLDGLIASDARFKIILTSVPLDFGTTGSDSWMGYLYERDLMWDTIIDEGIDGVVFIAADQHWFSAHHHNSGFKEFMSCPLTRHLRNPPSPTDDHVVSTLKEYNFSIMTYDPSGGGSILMEGFTADGALLYSEEILAGRGRIEVDASAPTAFSICPREMIGPDCTHVFDGSTPATFEYAVPGPYQIFFEMIGGSAAPPSQSGILSDDGTLSFYGEYGSGDYLLYEPFPDGTGWTVVDDGDGSSDWVFSSGVARQNSNIYSGPTDNEGPIEKLGTLIYYEGSDWDDVTMTVRFQTTDDDGIGVIARYADNDNYYRFSLDNERSFARLVVRDEGVFSLLAEDTSYIGYHVGEWTWIRLAVVGNQIDGYVSHDGMVWEHVLSAGDDSIASGSVGLYCWGANGVAFDDVTVAAAE